MDHGLRLDEIKTGKMGGASAAKTFVLASEATLQLASLHLTAKPCLRIWRRGAFGR